MNVNSKKIILLLLICHLIMALYVAANWLSYNCFEGGEGSFMTWAYQAAHGLPLYGVRSNPNLQELFAYTPLAMHIYGLVFKLLPFDVQWMRLVNFLFGLGASLMVGMIAFSLCRSKFMAFISSVLMLVNPSPWWFIAPGHNSIHAFFALLGMYWLIRESQPSRLTIVLAIVALFASFWTKQTGLPYLVAGLIYLLGVNLKKGLFACLAAAIVSGGMLGYYAVKYPGAMYNIFVLQAQHPILWDRLLNPVLFPDIFGRFSVLLAVILAGVWINYKWRFKELFRPELLFLGAAGVVGVIAPLKYGSGSTQTIVFYGLILACGMSFIKKLYDQALVNEKVLDSLVIVQILLLLQDPRPVLWRDCDQKRFDELCSIVATPGKLVHYNDNPAISLIVGKPFYAQSGRDCYVNGRIDKSKYPKELSEFLSSDPFDMVIIDVPLEDNSWPLYERLNASYKPIGELPALPGDPNWRKNFKKVIFARKEPLVNK